MCGVHPIRMGHHHPGLLLAAIGTGALAQLLGASAGGRLAAAVAVVLVVLGIRALRSMYRMLRRLPSARVWFER